MGKNTFRRLPATTRDTKPTTAPRRLPMLLRRAWFNLNQAFRRRSSQAGITPDQYTVLRTLSEHAPTALTQRELADCITSDPNTITSLLKRMEESGLIERRADPQDRRAQRVQLTASGYRIFCEALPLAATLQAEVLACLPHSRRAGFLRELEIVAEACEQAQRRTD